MGMSSWRVPSGRLDHCTGNPQERFRRVSRLNAEECESTVIEKRHSMSIHNMEFNFSAILFCIQFQIRC